MEFESKVLAKEILSVAYKTGKTVGTAESCTSGQIAAAITMVPGASNYFKGGIISYATEVKVNILGVPQQLIDEHTVVSEECAKAMVKGAIKTLNVDYAVAATGYAGPDGGEDGTPAGTIWIACGNNDEQIAIKLTEDNGRAENIVIATHTALQQLHDFIQSHEVVKDTEKAPIIPFEN